MEAKAYWPLSHQFITPPKVITGSDSDAKRVKWLRNQRKVARNHAKKRLVKQGKHIGSSFKNQENIKWKQRPVIFAKNGRFNSGQNGRVGISLEFPCKNFLHLTSLCTWYILFLKLLIPPSKVKWSRGPCHDHLFISFHNQIHLASV